MYSGGRDMNRGGMERGGMTGHGGMGNQDYGHSSGDTGSGSAAGGFRDLDEEFANEKIRLAQLTNKCSDEDIEFYVREAGDILGITDMAAKAAAKERAAAKEWAEFLKKKEEDSKAKLLQQLQKDSEKARRQWQAPWVAAVVVRGLETSPPST